MLLKDLKRNMLLPKREIFINKTVKLREIDVHLLSITSEEHRNILWVMYQLPYNTEERIAINKEIEYATNKDKMINDISKEMDYSNIHISEIVIQKQKMTFFSSSASRINYMSHEGYMQMQHFIENGLVTTDWDEVDLENIFIAAYEQEKGEEFPEIDLSKELAITLKVSKDFRQVLINQPMHLEFGEMERGNKLYFYDSIEKKNRIFYIDKLKRYDIWEEAYRSFENYHTQGLSKEQIKQMQEEYLNCLEKTCPRGMDLAMLEYETEDDVQLNFYTEEYLYERPVESDSSAIGMIFGSDKKLGSNGFKTRMCMIKPIEKTFNSSIDIELFSWYMEIPEEIVTI